MRPQNKTKRTRPSLGSRTHKRRKNKKKKKKSLGPPVYALRFRPGYQNKFLWRNLNLVRDEGRMSSEALFEQVLT